MAMIRKKPPIAPKAAQQGAGEQPQPESRASSSLEHGGHFGPTRPRSPRPSEVYSAALAELTEGDGRGLTKVKAAGSASPVSSPGRRRTMPSVTTVNLSLNPMSPRATSILDHSGSTGRATSSSGGACIMLSGSARALSALEDQLRSGGPSEGLTGSGGLPSTPPRKATSAPDSQSIQAALRSPANPWHAAHGEQLAPLSDPQHAQHAQHHSPHHTAHPPPHSPKPAAAGHPHGHGRGTSSGAAGRAHTGQPGSGAGVTSPPGAAGLPPGGLPSVAVGGSGRQRRDSVSSTDSHAMGVYDSPMAASGGPSTLRVAALGRTGSPNSPSTPSASCSSQPHTPTSSAFRPRPPGEAPTPASRSSRKYSHLASPEARQGQQPQQPQATSTVAPPPQAQQQAQQQYVAPQEPHPPAVGLAAVRQLRLQTGQDDFGPPPPLRTSSLRSEGGAPGSATSASAAAAAALALFSGSQPGTPSSVSASASASASRPNSGRGGSARLSSRPVASLVDAIRSRDDGKLAEVLEALRGVQGNILGLNDRHHVTCRTPLHEAAAANSPSMVAMLLAAGADPNIGHPTQGPPLLHCAAYGNLETMLLLLQGGADVHATDVERGTALHCACAGGHVDAARLLIKYGADVQARNEEGQAPFDQADPEMLRLVLAAGPPPSVDGGAAAAGDAAEVCSPERRSPPSSASAARRMSHAAAAAAAARAAAAAMASEGGAATGPSGRGGSGGPRRGPASGGGGRPPSGSTGGGMLHSPTVPIDLSGAAASAGMRPAPPSADAQAAGAARSRRNSGTLATGPPPPPGPGASPLRRNSGGGAAAADGSPAAAAAAPASSTATTPTPAPTSPLFSDGEAAPPPASPPTLRLPGGVRRQLSRGAVLGDIMTAFQQEDAEMVNKSHVGLGPVLQVGGFAGLPPPGLPMGPSAAAAKAKEPRPAVPAVGFMPPGLPTGVYQPSTSRPSSREQDNPPPQQQPLLPFNMPETSVIRFGFRLQVHGPEDGGEVSLSGGVEPSAAGGGGGSESGATASRQASGTVAMPSFSGGLGAAGVGFTPPPLLEQPSSAASGGSANGGGGGGFNAVGFTPVPATGFTPRFSSNGGGGGAVGFTPVPATGFSPLFGSDGGAGVSGGGGSNAGGPVYRMSGSGDDFGAPPPPLVRDSSPVRDRPSVSGAAGSGGGAGGSAGGSGGRNAQTRTSQRAAQALKQMSVVSNSMSMDAIEVRAAAMFRQSTDLTTGELAWTKGELLGEGAYGKVYAGLNQQTGELMAVKVLQLVTKANGNNKEAAMRQLAELEHEMQMYKQLKNKHVVGFIDARYDPQTSALYIFLEYVPGGSIASMLTRFKHFSEELVRNYTRQLLEGLEYLHGCKIVHRDLKGGNVLVSRDGVVKLADFGASKAYREHTITDCLKSVRGSVFWMAPEVIRGTGYGRAADIWSLGCTVIEMLTGRHPWPDLDNQMTAMFTIAKTEEGPPRPRGVSQEALRFLDRCLQFDPARRPSATELLQDPFVAPRPGSVPSGQDLQHSV